MNKLNRSEMLQLIKLDRESKIRSARKSFWCFCKLMIPSIYTDDKIYLTEICVYLQALYEGTLINPKTNKKFKGILLSLPPGHAKSLTVQLFTMWCFGNDINNEVMTISYNTILSTRFATNVRDTISQESSKPTAIVYSDIFPNTKIKYGDGAKGDWALEGRHHSYLATSFTSTATGLRCNIMIIDDPVADDTVALNKDALESLWTTYKDKLLSRLVEGGITIVIQTRWSKDDLIGKFLKHQPGKWKELVYKAYDEEKDIMLCDFFMTKESYFDKKELTSEMIFLANYQQKCIDKKGALYKIQDNLYKDHEVRDVNGQYMFDSIVAYVDTADTGKDYLAGVVSGIYKSEIYVLDMAYTQDSMEITEPLIAKMLYENKVTECWIESNNGGRGFARNVERILWETYGSKACKIHQTPQTKNKLVRILNGETFINAHVFFPENVKIKYSKVWEHLLDFQRVGKNTNDDIEDCLTGLTEKVKEKYNLNSPFKRNFSPSMFDKGNNLKVANGNNAVDYNYYKRYKKKKVF